VAKAKAARPHYLAASLIGGFGEPDTGRHAGRLRCSWVCVRWTCETSVVSKIRADNVAIQNGVYDVAEPGPNLPSDFAEQLWQQYEGALPAAIRAQETGSWTPADWETVLLHVQAQAIRHPDFTRAVHEHIGPAAAARLSPDDIQAERQRTYRDTRLWMSRARFALLRHHRPAPRFLTNDKGYVPLHDIWREIRGVVFPLSGLVAALMVVDAAQPGDDYEQGPVVERTLNPAGMQIINDATWDTAGIRCVIGHPADSQAIEALSTGEKLTRMPELGPYGGNRESGLFDWACSDPHLAVRPKRKAKRG
jgi:hypothetical protein